MPHAFPNFPSFGGCRRHHDVFWESLQTTERPRGTVTRAASRQGPGCHLEELALLWQILSGEGFPNQFFCDSWVVGLRRRLTMRSDWQKELGRFLNPFLARLGHKARRQMCPLYVRGLIGPGAPQRIQPTAE